MSSRKTVIESPLMNLDDVASYLSVSDTILYCYTKHKKIPTIEVDRIWCFRKETLMNGWGDRGKISRWTI